MMAKIKNWFENHTKVLYVLIAALLLVGVYNVQGLAYNDGKCRACGADALEYTNQIRVHAKGGHSTNWYIYECQRCGNLWEFTFKF